MPDFKNMTTAQLIHEVNSLKGLAYLASQRRDGRSFGRLNRQLDAAYAEQDRRRKAKGA